jgi:hypothetical protein
MSLIRNCRLGDFELQDKRSAAAPAAARGGDRPGVGGHGLESAARPDLPLLELLRELSAVSGFQNPVRVARNHDSQGETRVSAPRSHGPLTRLGNDSFSVRNGVFETLKIALTAWLRLGESAECAERARTCSRSRRAWWEGDACHGGRIRRRQGRITTSSTRPSRTASERGSRGR